MDIKEALLQPGTRLSNSNGRWMCMDELYVLGGEFVVYDNATYNQRSSSAIYRGMDEEKAVTYLLDLSKEEEQERLNGLR